MCNDVCIPLSPLFWSEFRIYYNLTNKKMREILNFLNHIYTPLHTHTQQKPLRAGEVTWGLIQDYVGLEKGPFHPVSNI